MVRLGGTHCQKSFMAGLLPRDYWEYGVADALRATAAALISRRPGGTLNLGELDECIPVNSGRAGLLICLKALDLGEGARIGVPLYCCPIVFKAILAAGYVPHFLDVDPVTFCVSSNDLAAKLGELDALIAVHMFGNVCDMPALIETAKGKPVIEDCAQAIGSSFSGQLAGSFGAAAVFSFRSGKYVSSGEGGALFSTSPDFRSRLAEQVSKMPIPRPSSEMVHVAKTYLKSLLRRWPLYGVAGNRIWRYYNGRGDFSARNEVITGPMRRSDLAVARKRLACLSLAIQRQRASADFYLQNLELDSGMLCEEGPQACYNRAHFPVTFRTPQQRDSMAEHLFRGRIDSMKYLDGVTETATKHFAYAGDCPIAENLAKRVLVIPNYHSLKRRDVERITKTLNAGWKHGATAGYAERRGQALVAREP